MGGSGGESTIPSILAEEAKNKGVNCEIVNFGQYAYVSAQEVIELTLQLQKGNIPDIVIFYDGVNDTFSGFQLSVPGLPHDEIRREKEFCLLERKELQTLAVQSAIRQLSTVRFLHGVLQIGFMRLDGSDIRFLGHSYNEIVDYWKIPRAIIVPNGKLVVFDSEFCGASSGDVYVVEAPLR